MKNFHIIDILPRIGALIQQKSLTKLLISLESLGYYGDDAIGLLTYLQKSEVQP